MRLVLPAVLLVSLLTGCKPTVHDFMLESRQAFQPYVTGDVQVAKSALLAEEKVIAKYEAARTSGFDAHGAYIITYARLCALHLYMGETNQAQEYFQRAIAHRRLKSYAPTGEVTMDVLLTSIKDLDATINPKWRQAMILTNAAAPFGNEAAGRVLTPGR
jgi:hypothetical protein